MKYQVHKTESIQFLVLAICTLSFLCSLKCQIIKCVFLGFCIFRVLILAPVVNIYNHGFIGIFFIHISQSADFISMAAAMLSIRTSL